MKISDYGVVVDADDSSSGSAKEWAGQGSGQLVCGKIVISQHGTPIAWCEVDSAGELRGKVRVFGAEAAISGPAAAFTRSTLIATVRALLQDDAISRHWDL